VPQPYRGGSREHGRRRESAPERAGRRWRPRVRPRPSQGRAGARCPRTHARRRVDHLTSHAMCRRRSATMQGVEQEALEPVSDAPLCASLSRAASPRARTASASERSPWLRASTPGRPSSCRSCSSAGLAVRPTRVLRDPEAEGAAGWVQVDPDVVLPLGRRESRARELNHATSVWPATISEQRMMSTSRSGWTTLRARAMKVKESYLTTASLPASQWWSRHRIRRRCCAPAAVRST